MTEPAPPGGASRARALLVGLVLAALAAIVVRLAWLGDDAYITLRSVENWVAGNGLRWNPTDRVQTYTHPAWMLLLAAGRAISGEVYVTTLVLSFVLSLVAAAALLARATTVPAVAAIAAVLLGTRAFLDYTTSGLETPLTYVLLAAFVRVVTRENVDPGRRFVHAVLLASLAATTRLDLALLCAPAVLATTRGVPWTAALRLGAAAALPLLVWLAVATVWYGTPLPVTAHAKAFGVGIPAGELAAQGLRYLQFAVSDDPVLLPAIALGLGVGLAGRGGPLARWLALGALLYVGYVVKVGGDFMAGRFLLPPFVVAVAVLASWLSAQRPRVAVAVAAGALVLAALRGVPAWLQPPSADVAPTEAELVAQWGIGDERRVYYAEFGLLAPRRRPLAFGELHAQVRPGGGERWLLLNGAVGRAGFGAGAQGHVVDPLLCDPLLTRLPAKDPTKWRIGHVLRRIPEGYYETLATGTNRVRHPGLRAYVDALHELTRAPVFSSERWATWWRFVRGELDAGFRDYVATDYREPPRVVIPAKALPPPLPLGTYWFDEPRLHVIHDGGIALELGDEPGGGARARTLRLQVGGFCAFRVRFLRDGAVRGEAVATPLPPPPGLDGLRAATGLREEAVAVPAAVADYDTLWVDAVETAMSHAATGPPFLGALVRVPD